MKRAGKRFIKKAVVSAVTAAAILCGTMTSSEAVSKAFAKEENRSADVREPETDKLKGKVVILHSGDVHGAVDGYARMTSLKDEMVKAGAEVIMADAGGFTQEEVSEEDSFKTIDGFMLMSSLGYTVSTVGDTELQQGYDELKKNVGAAKFRLVCSNLFKEDKSLLTPGYLHQTEAGIKIGFFGLSDPGQYEGLTVLSDDDMYERAKEQIDILKSGGADIVVGLSHIGTEQASDLYKKTEDIDFIIDGGSNDAITEVSKGEPIQSCGEDFAYIGVIVIDKESGIADHYLVKTEDIEADPGVQEAVDKLKERMVSTVEIGSTDEVKASGNSLSESDEMSEASDASDASEKDKGATDGTEAKTESVKKSEYKLQDNKEAEIEDQLETEKSNNAVSDDAAEVGADDRDEAGEDGGDKISSGDDGTYEVVQGDCLWKIAERHLGDGARWTEIYELNINIISNPSLIYVGQQLVLPPG